MVGEVTSGRGASRDGFVDVPGARLYYKLRGTGPGPLLLVAPGGATDADGSDALADELADRYGHPVLTYDRRGLSRSRLDDGAPMSAVIETHADDMHRLVAAVTDRPVLVFGSSIGALISLEFAAAHPDRIRLLIAHEAALAALLAEPDRSRVAAMQRGVEEAFEHDGILRAMQRLLEFAGDPADDPAPEIGRTMPGGRRAARFGANLKFFLAHDVGAAHRHRLDLAALKAAAGVIVPAAGELSRGLLPYSCTQALAAQLDRPLVEFPGGHTGYAQRPRAFAAAFERTLAEYAD